ncbi:carbohydrate-binding domain-containing protein [Faecalibacterium prausnitzii]|nr:carbohydrate-binding domain-containing protein [Faecalibacterium prausnitzii]
MLTTLAAPAFAGTWSIENGDITVKAGETGNDVTQNNVTTKNDTDTIITNSDKDTASSHTVTIETNDKNDKVEVTLDNVNIKADSGSALTSKGDVTLTLKGDNSLTGGNGGSGISSSGSLTISGGENNSLTAQGGSGSGIFSSGGVTISGGTVTANGDDGGRGISSSGSLTISGGSTVTANGGNGTISGGDGICSSGGVTISGGTVNATGGTGGTGENSNGGSGIYIYSSSGSLTVSGGTVTAKGGNGDSKDGYGGDGIRSGGGVTISGNTVNAAGGYGGKVGGYGICSFDRVAISGGTVEAAGGNGSTGGGSGIYSSVIDLSGSLELTAKAGSPNGKALSQKGSELVLDTIKDKLGPGAKVTATDANGKVNQVSIPGPVEPEKPVIPEESSSSSDGGSAAPSAPTSPLPGLTVTDKSGAVISYTSTQSGNTLTVCVGRFTASFRISLAALRQLRAEGIETITFQTILCSTTLSVDELLAMGGEDAEAVLTHRFTDSSLTVG